MDSGVDESISDSNSLEIDFRSVLHKVGRDGWDVVSGIRLSEDEERKVGKVSVFLEEVCEKVVHINSDLLFVGDITVRVSDG